MSVTVKKPRTRIQRKNTQAILDAALQKDEAQVRANIRAHLARNLIWPVPDLDAKKT